MTNRTPVHFAFLWRTNGREALVHLRGCSPEDKDSVAAFITSTTDTTTPARLDDMHTLMCADVTRKGGRDLGTEPRQKEDCLWQS